MLWASDRKLTLSPCLLVTVIAQVLPGVGLDTRVPTR